MISDIKEIINLFSKGEMIILVDDEERENEGDLVISSKYLTADHINFMITYGKGLVCAPISSTVAKKLKLPLMEGVNNEMQTPYTHSVDLKGDGVTTGISAEDRFKPIKGLASEGYRGIMAKAQAEADALKTEQEQEFELLKNSFKSINNIVDKQKQCDKLKETIETLKKDNFVLINEIKNSNGDTKTQKMKDYIKNNNEIQKSNIKLKEILSSIKNILILKPPEIKRSDIDIVENTNDDSISDKLINYIVILKKK